MSRGRETKFASRGHRHYTVPKREQFLDHDFFYPCQRCGDPWPRKDLLREPVTRLLVCPNDYDEPSQKDVESRLENEIRFRREDRLQKHLRGLP